MCFTPDPTKQVQEVIFFCKTIKANHPLLFFNGNSAVETDIQKHLLMFLVTKLKFLDHLKIVFEKRNKTIGLLCKPRLVLLRSSLLIIYKSFVRAHLNYGGIIYDLTSNATFHQKMEAMQYNAA